MSKFRGTKGKWYKDVTKKNRIIVRLGESKIIELGTIYSDDCNHPACCKTEEHANALLISKAPEMLEMLNTINECRTDFDRWGEIAQLIKEATDLTIKEVSNEQ